MPSSNVSEQKPFSFKLILLALAIYGLAHLSPALPWVSPSSFVNGLGPQTVMAQEDEEDDEEDEEDDEEDEDEEEGEEEGEGEAEEEDTSYLYDIG